MAKRPSNETIIEQLRRGLAEFELTSSPVPSVSSYGPHSYDRPPSPSVFLTANSHRFFARIGPPIGGGSQALKKAQRFSIQKVTGDGRCLFRALVKGMALNKGTALSPHEERENADELRMAVKEVICDNDKERLQYEEALIAITLEESLKRYCHRIGRSDFWGGESELLVLSKLCCQPITVYIPEHELGGRGYGFIPIAEYGAQFSKGSRKGKAQKAVRLLYSERKTKEKRKKGRVYLFVCYQILPLIDSLIVRRMEGASNGGMLYHEVQESKLCAVHCVNTVLQGPFFSEFDLAALASDLDRRERQMMLQAGGDFLPDLDESHNVSLDGDFSIQVLEKALEVWDLQVIPLDSPVAEPAQFDPELENAFICHLQNHWFCIRKVNGEWYNFDSLYAAPEHLSKFYLSAYLSTLKGSGWSIFLVRGNFPKEFPIASSEASNGFGQWLSPEDAERITKSCNSTRRTAPGSSQTQQFSDPYLQHGDEGMPLDEDDEDLKAAIAASLMDPTSAVKDIPADKSDENKDSGEENIRE